MVNLKATTMYNESIAKLQVSNKKLEILVDKDLQSYAIMCFVHSV